jgi:hypothetical protein
MRARLILDAAATKRLLYRRPIPSLDSIAPKAAF